MVQVIFIKAQIIFFYFFNDIPEALEWDWLLITPVYSVKHIGLKIFENQTAINKQNIHLREDKRKCILLIRKCKLKNFGNSKHAQAFNVAELSIYQRKAIIKSYVHQKLQTLTQNLLQRFQMNAWKMLPIIWCRLSYVLFISERGCLVSDF